MILITGNSQLRAFKVIIAHFPLAKRSPLTVHPSHHSRRVRMNEWKNGGMHVPGSRPTGANRARLLERKFARQFCLTFGCWYILEWISPRETDCTSGPGDREHHDKVFQTAIFCLDRSSTALHSGSVQKRARAKWERGTIPSGGDPVKDRGRNRGEKCRFLQNWRTGSSTYETRRFLNVIRPSNL